MYANELRRVRMKGTEKIVCKTNNIGDKPSDRECTCLNTSEVRNQAVPVNIDSTLIDKRRKKWAEPRFYGMIPIPMHRCNVTYFLDIKIIVIWREKKSAAFFFTFFSSVIRSCVCVCVYAIGVLRILFFSYIFALYHMKLAHSFEHP